jgi:hypothetical protein
MSLSRSTIAFVIALPLMLIACEPQPEYPTDGSSSSAASSVHPDISLSSPAPDATVTSPLVVTGEARGSWYFEASFPVRLLDSNGNELAVAPAQAQGDWMTTDFVPFSVTLTFTTTDTSGTLVLEKDNPSGLPENADSISIPVQF